MARPLTRAQRLENAAFLKALERTGNVRESARMCGLKYGTMQHRRRTSPDFAVRWDAALVIAQGRLAANGPFRPARSPAPASSGGASAGQAGSAGLRTVGGEQVVILLKSGRLQLRRAQPGKLTREAEQAFLLALSATANISLAAASVGVAEAAFHRRKRRNPAFAREWRAALAEGYQRLEMALIASWSPDSGEGSEWRDNDPPALPPMTPAQALQLLYLHHKAVRWREGSLQRALLPGESGDVRSARLARLYRARLAEQTENELARKVVGDGATPPIALPDLAQVTGWSRADPAATPHGDAALFGGWRVEQMAAAGQKRGRRR